MALKQPKPTARDRKFRIIGRNKSRETLQLVCNSCAHEFTIKTSPENFYFKCQSIACEERSNIQDVLIIETEMIPDKKTNPEFGITEAQRKELINELLQLHPQPKEALNGR